VDFPTNSGHPTKGVNSPREVQHGEETATAEYVEVFDHSRRRHPSLGYISPAEYEQRV
jgi:transposase InsO family protein